LEALVGTDKRLKLIAEDLVKHFDHRLEAMDGKAMIVCMSRRICVELYKAQTSLPLVIVRPEWICAKMLVGQEDSGFCKSAAAGLRPENGNGTFLP
jgi:hypothetical protein